MHVAIANERLLPRFGVDRLLVLLAHDMVRNGHRVSFYALRCDRGMLEEMGEVTLLEMPPGLDMAATEREALRQMEPHLARTRPDALVSGGWPFFRTARSSPVHGVASLFIDAGAVAQDGLEEPLLSIQRELRRVRQQELPFIDRVLPISRFIRDSQTMSDRGHSGGVRTVLLGGDHMAQNVFQAADDEQGMALLSRLEMLRTGGAPLLLLLGRFENVGYKDSAQAYPVLRHIRKAVPRATLLLLDAGVDCNIPADLSEMVITLGQPSDAALQQIMRMCALGLSLSLWEGFNLPLAEMQFLAVPALAFNLGAHPEVIAHPWLLCETQEEMAEKAVRLLTRLAPGEVIAALQAGRERLRWADTLAAWMTEIESAVKTRRAESRTAAAVRVILVDVTNAAIDPANSGVMRVTRTLCANLQGDQRLRLLFARWDTAAGTYLPLTEEQRTALAGYGGPVDRFSAVAELLSIDALIEIQGPTSTPAALFLPEVALDGQALRRVAWARGRGMPVGAILYDVIPIDHPEYCDQNVAAVFTTYLAALLRIERIWSISEYSISRLRAYTAGIGSGLPDRAEVVWLPGQFGRHARPAVERPAAEQGEIRILCLSTLEPRKNHATLLAAWELVQARRPDLPLSLRLVGNRYAGAPHVAEMVEQLAARDKRFIWRGVLDDAGVAAEIAAASFTIYPSLVEGFGLPILESLWMGRPCIVHETGVMSELAAPGGCLCVDMRDRSALAAAIEHLATDRALLSRLAEEARGRVIATWRDYARELGASLFGLSVAAEGTEVCTTVSA